MTTSPAIPHQRHSLLVSYFWIVAFAGLLQAIVTRTSADKSAEWFSLSFYFFLPAILWTISFPLIRHAFFVVGNLRWFVTWPAHLALSLGLSVVIKFVALFIDFQVQHSIGTLHGSFPIFFSQVQNLFVTACLQNMAIYWILILTLQIIHRPASPVASPDLPRRFTIKDQKHVVNIACQDIQYVEAFGNYLKIHTEEKTYCHRATIKSIESKLPPDSFYRVHRSYILNEDAILALRPAKTGTYLVQLKTNVTLTTGRQYVARVTLLAAQWHSIHHKKGNYIPHS